MVERLRTSVGTLELTLLKSGPRWHKAMGSDDWRAGADGPDVKSFCQEHVLCQKRLHGCDVLMILAALFLPNAALMFLFSDIGVGLQVFNFFAGPADWNFRGNVAIGFGWCLGTCLYIADWQKGTHMVPKIVWGMVVV